MKFSTKILLLFLLPLFLIFLIISLIYIFSPLEWIPYEITLGIALGFYLWIIIFYVVIYVTSEGWGKEKVLTIKDHQRSGLISLLVSAVLIGIFIIGIMSQGYALNQHLLNVFKIWIFIYLISTVTIDSITWFIKKKKNSE